MFVYAHQDDELFTLPLLREFLALGDEVVCVYLTSGSFNCDEKVISVRNEESVHILTKLGVRESSILFLGQEHRINDGELYQRLESAIEGLESVSAQGVESVFLPAWEGGHQDHDACHVVGKLFCRLHSIERVFEFSLYNGYKLPGPLFNVMALIPRENSSIAYSARLTLIECISMFRYRSQLTTWLALAPFVIFKFLVRSEMEYRLVDVSSLLSKPHTGSLYYEKRFGVSYIDFSNTMSKSSLWDGMPLLDSLDIT